MPKYMIYAAITGSKYLGEVEAANKEEAEELGWALEEGCVILCHQCSSECEDPEISEIIVEESRGT